LIDFRIRFTTEATEKSQKSCEVKPLEVVRKTGRVALFTGGLIRDFSVLAVFPW